MLDLFIAVLIDWVIGDPQKFPHPVRLFGNLITREEKRARRIASSEGGLRICGFMIVVFNIAAVYGATALVLRFAGTQSTIFHIINIYLLYTTVAARCLRDEAVKIIEALGISIEAARHRLSYIVGRDTTQLEEAQIVRATVETVAENTSDGVIAPLLFAMIGGAPLALTYKMINTMDSMLGYMNEKYRYIGFFPAKTDDVFNFIPARITGILMCIYGFLRFDGKNGLRIMIRDRKNHKSPNCAYPEGAAAGLLHVQLGGTNTYFGETVTKPVIGDADRLLVAKDIKNVIEIMFGAELVMMAIYSCIQML